MAWSHIQTAGNQPTGSQPNTTVTLALSATAGNLLLVGVTLHGNTQQSATVTDNKGNTYTKILAAFGGDNGAGPNTTSEMHAAVLTAGGSGLVITITPAASTFLAGVADEFSATSAFAADVSGSATGVAGQTPVSPGSLTPTGTALVYSVLSPRDTNPTGTISAGSGYTLGTAFSQAANKVPVASEYLLDAPAGTTTPTWSLATNNGWVSLGAAWKVTAAGIVVPYWHLFRGANAGLLDTP
jgi:hypothetical protein